MKNSIETDPDSMEPAATLSVSDKRKNPERD